MLCEPSSSKDVSARAGSVLRDVTTSSSSAARVTSSTGAASGGGARRTMTKEDAQRMLLSELKHRMRSGRSPITDDDGTQVTIIQKKNKVRNCM